MSTNASRINDIVTLLVLTERRHRVVTSEPAEFVYGTPDQESYLLHPLFKEFRNDAAISIREHDGAVIVKDYEVEDLETAGLIRFISRGSLLNHFLITELAASLVG